MSELKFIFLLLSVIAMQACAVIWLAPKNTVCGPGVAHEDKKGGEKQ